MAKASPQSSLLAPLALLEETERLVTHTEQTVILVVFQVELPFPLETEKRDFKFHLKLPEGFTVAQLK